MKFLRNDDIILRAVEPKDADKLWNIETDSSQWLQNGMMAPLSRYYLKEYAQNYDADPIRAGQLRMVIESADSCFIYGLIDLYDISPVNRTAFVGIYICEAFRHKGFAKQALMLMECYARQLLNLRILAVRIAEDNELSRQLFLKSEYLQCGVLKDWMLSGDKTTSLYIFSKKL